MFPMYACVWSSRLTSCPVYMMSVAALTSADVSSCLRSKLSLTYVNFAPCFYQVLN